MVSGAVDNIRDLDSAQILVHLEYEEAEQSCLRMQMVSKGFWLANKPRPAEPVFFINAG